MPATGGGTAVASGVYLARPERSPKAVAGTR